MLVRNSFHSPRKHHRDAPGILPQQAAVPEIIKSAARLAAEMAFSVAPPPSAEPPPTVIVRRSRGLTSDKTASGPSAQPALAVAAEPVRDPRTFRLRAPPPGAEAVAQASADDLPLTTANGAPPKPRKKRVAAEQRPGPVLHIFKAPPPVVTVEESAAGGREVTRQQLAELARMLADVQRVLEEVRRAQAFQFHFKLAADSFR